MGAAEGHVIPRSKGYPTHPHPAINTPLMRQFDIPYAGQGSLFRGGLRVGKRVANIMGE